MNLFQTLKLKRARRKLLDAYTSGRRVSHLPGFLDRSPDHRLHRAIRHAFLRGFKYEESVKECGFNQQEWDAFHALYKECEATLPMTKQDPRSVFYDWEFDELKKVFETFKRSDPVCAQCSRA